MKHILKFKNKAPITVVFLFLLISACGEGDSADGVLGSVVQTGEPAEDINPSNDTPSPLNPPATPPSFPFRGTITVDEYDWFSASQPYLGVIDVTLNPLSKKRLLNGSQPRRHSSGSIVYRQPCGSRVHRILVVAEDLSSSSQITPCSSELSNPGASATNFGFSALSPDASKIAVEALYFLNSQFQVATVVYDTSSQSLLSVWGNVGAPMWLPNGDVLLSSGVGFYVGTVGEAELRKLPDGLTSGVSNPALNPIEDIIAFEYNQQIWLMDSDGANAREAIFAGSKLRYPTWSPDGKSLAYLSLPDGDRYEDAIFFTNLETQQSYRLDLDPVMSPSNTSATVNGPMSWR